MGDRANIVIRERWPADLGDSEAVFLYTHWEGTELPETLRRGLSAARGRWDDAPYLARILFQTMVGDNEGQTGFSISTRLTDNEYDLLVLRDDRIYLVEERLYKATGFATLDQVPSLTFDDLVDDAVEPMTWARLQALAKPAGVAS